MSELAARVVSVGENDEKLCARARMRDADSPGTLSILRPKKSLT